MGRFSDWSFQKHRRQTLVTVIVSLALFGVGCAICWSATSLPSLSKNAIFKGLTKFQEAWIVSLALFGALVSVPIWGMIMDRIGRKNTIVASAILQVIGFLLTFLANQLSFALIYAGRLITGVGLAGTGMAVPAYISDIADSDIRGALGSVGQILLISGFLFYMVISSILSWDYSTLVSALPLLIPVLCFHYLPESPRSSLVRRKTLAALRSLRWLREGRASESVDEEIVTIMATLEQLKDEHDTFSDYFSWRLLKPLLSCCLLMVFQQLSGFAALITDAVAVFKSVSDDEIDAYCCIIVVGIFLVAFAVINTILIDFAGRRLVLIISGLIMSISHFTVAFIYLLRWKVYSGDDCPPGVLNWIGVVALTAYFIGFALGFFPIPWLIASEIIQTRVIGVGTMFVIISQYGTGFFTVFGYQEFVKIMDEESRNVCIFAFFGIISLLGTLFVILTVTETKRKTLEQIQKG